MNFSMSLLCLVIVINNLEIIICDETNKTDSSISTRSIDSSSDEKPLRINLSSSTISETKTTVSNKQTINSKSNTHQIQNTKSKNSNKSSVNHQKVKKEKLDYDCPNTSDFSFFPTYCSKHLDCFKTGKEYRCCKQFGSKRCVRGIPQPIQEPRHEPILGLIPRKCPKEPLGETFWELKTCNTDHDCWPRVCCPDGRKKYCRTSKPELDGLPAGRQLSYPIDALSGYIQCTAPPPSGFDLHPKECNNTLDCFPNVCCQESGKKYCRPPKRSLLAFITTFAQRFNTGIIKQWTSNLVIRK